MNNWRRKLHNSGYQTIFMVGFLLLVAVASGLDLFWDLSLGFSAIHLLQELMLLLMALAGLIWMAIRFTKNQKEVQRLQEELESSRMLASQQSEAMKDAKRRMADVIHDQFQSWQLTSSEKEVGLLMLKGLTFREAAVVRSVAEKTIRQQASSIYEKSGLSGRHEFAGWFLEDLF